MWCFSFAVLLLLCGCAASPSSSYESASTAFLRGELQESQNQAETGYRRFQASNPEWAWRFRLLQAKAALWRGLYEDVASFLSSPPPNTDTPEFSVPRLALISVADTYLHNFPLAEKALTDASRLCETAAIASCGDVLQARGFLASERSQSAEAEQMYGASLKFAREHGDRYLESTSLLNLGNESLAQGHFDEAIERSEEAYEIARAIDARMVALIAQGNIGWARYKLGDIESASKLLIEAEELARQLNSVSNQENGLTNIGYVRMEQRRYGEAAESFQSALELAQKINAKTDIYNAQRVLARLSLQTGDVDKASSYAAQALEIARASKNQTDELYPLLVQGQIAARRGDTKLAQQTFESIAQDKFCPVFLKWEAQHSLARLFEDGNRRELADRQYRAALAAFETARADVRHEDFHLSFLTNGWRIYDDYIHFLVTRSKADDALRWADYSRGRTLSEGLGIVSKGAVADPPPLNAVAIARLQKATLLFYWLGEKQSYLWAITPQKTNLYTLPPGGDIDAAVGRYRDALASPAYSAANPDKDGLWLYRTLLGPAEAAITKESPIYIVPDGTLNNLNFETLMVSGPKPHYWIEDATIANASSLRMLATPYVITKKADRRLLLIGDSVPPNDKYPAVAGAAAQMESVANYFPNSRRHVLSREAANPSNYLDSHPEQFSDLHFVAHGIASRLSPLDSAIVLSRPRPGSDAFKLYARDIITRPLRADLVAISACYGTGTRTFTGEGLVGLSWAFLRAGAHNVVAALWDASGTSTEKLMARFYEELDRGESNAVALRKSKLALLRDPNFSNPYYWAVFQLYSQGQPATATQPARRAAAAYDITRAVNPLRASNDSTGNSTHRSIVSTTH